MRGLEQKSVSCMRDLVKKFSRTRNSMMDFSAGTWSTVKTSMLIDDHKKFEECDVDPEVQSAADPEILRKTFFTMMSWMSDIRGSGKMRAATKGPTDEVGAVLLERKLLCDTFRLD